MHAADRSAEALLYWRTVRKARQIIRSNPQANVTEQQDDLDIMALRSMWPRLRDAARSAALRAVPALTLDLTVFDMWPSEITELEQAR